MVGTALSCPPFSPAARGFLYESGVMWTSGDEILSGVDNHG